MIYDINKQQLIKKAIDSSTWGGGCSILIRSSYISPPAYTSSRPYTSEYSSSSSWRQFSLSHTHTHKGINTLQVKTFDLSMWVKAEINSGAFTVTFYSSLHNFQLTSEFELQNTVWLHFCFLTLPFLSLSFIQNVSGSRPGTWRRWRTLLNAKHSVLLICSLWQ